jgi:hypothetical protein
MRTLIFAVILLSTTAVGVAFHRPTSGTADASKVAAEPDVAVAALAKADALAKTDPKRAAAFYRACLALEGAAGDPATFRAARARLKALETPKVTVIAKMPTPVPTVVEKPQPRKGTVTALAAKIEPSPEVEAVKVEATPARAVSVGPDGVVYDEQP